MTASIQNIKELRLRTGAGMVDCKKALEESNDDVEQAIIWLREKGISKAAKKADRVAAEGLASVIASGNYAAVFEVNSETDFASKNEKFVQLVQQIEEVLKTKQPSNLETALTLEVQGETLQQVLINATATIGEKINLRRLEVVTKQDTDTFGHYVHMGGKIATLVVVANTSNEELAKDLAMHVAALNPSYIATTDIPADVVEKESAIQLATAKNDPELASKPEKVLQGIVKGRVNKALFESCLLEQPFVKDSTQSVGKYVASFGGKVVKFVRYMVGEGVEKKETNFAEEVAKVAGK